MNPRSECKSWPGRFKLRCSRLINCLERGEKFFPWFFANRQLFAPCARQLFQGWGVVLDGILTFVRFISPFDFSLLFSINFSKRFFKLRRDKSHEGKNFFRRNPFRIKENKLINCVVGEEHGSKINSRRICLIFWFTLLFFFIRTFMNSDLSLSREISSREDFYGDLLQRSALEERTVRGNGNYLLREERSKNTKIDDRGGDSRYFLTTYGG